MILSNLEPFELFLSITFFVGTIMVIVRAQRTRAERVSCNECGYDLTGHEVRPGCFEGLCPECGISPSQVTPAAPGEPIVGVRRRYFEGVYLAWIVLFSAQVAVDFVELAREGFLIGPEYLLIGLRTVGVLLLGIGLWRSRRSRPRRQAV